MVHSDLTFVAVGSNQTHDNVCNSTRTCLDYFYILGNVVYST